MVDAADAILFAVFKCGPRLHRRKSQTAVGDFEIWGDDGTSLQYDYGAVAAFGHNLTLFTPTDTADTVRRFQRLTTHCLLAHTLHSAIDSHI